MSPEIDSVPFLVAQDVNNNAVLHPFSLKDTGPVVLMMCFPLCPGARVPSETAAGSGQRAEEDNPAAQTRARHHRERLPQPQAAAPPR